MWHPSMGGNKEYSKMTKEYIYPFEKREEKEEIEVKEEKCKTEY